MYERTYGMEQGDQQERVDLPKLFDVLTTATGRTISKGKLHGLPARSFEYPKLFTTGKHKWASQEEARNKLLRLADTEAGRRAPHTPRMLRYIYETIADLGATTDRRSICHHPQTREAAGGTHFMLGKPNEMGKHTEITHISSQRIHLPAEQ
jgi:hypothetical protein